MTPHRKQRTNSKEPYSTLAEIYDGVMAHVNYRQWAQYINDLLSKHSVTNPTILDIACGTGSCVFELEKLGYKVDGQDISPFMIRQAKQKAQQKRSTAHFTTADMCTFEPPHQYNVILCLYDSLNYLKTEAAIQQALFNAYNTLTSRGFLIFDICSEWNSIAHFNGFHIHGTIQGIHYIRESHYVESEKIQYNTFQFTDLLTQQKSREHHAQRIYSIEEMKSLISRQWYIIRKIYADFTFNAPHEQDERYHFVLQKRR